MNQHKPRGKTPYVTIPMPLEDRDAIDKIISELLKFGIPLGISDFMRVAYRRMLRSSARALRAGDDEQKSIALRQLLQGYLE